MTSSIEQFLSALAREENVNPEIAEHANRISALLSTPAEASPFLTVLVRTQGRRLEALKDSLLCLAAQTVDDFEVLVLAHDVNEDGRAAIDEIVHNQVQEFGERIRLLWVEGGGRARPLNVGLENARGRYLAVFDDDDLVFGNWVEAFQAGADASVNRMIRANVATQIVEPEEWLNGAHGFRSQTWPKAEYAKIFDPFAHMHVNHSPFMSWAFPMTLFRTLGIRFDEGLDVCEDWDVIVRGSLMMGVQDAPTLTSIYRRWQGGSSSYSEHSQEEWRASEAAVVQKLDAVPLLLPTGTMTRVRREISLGRVIDLQNELHEIHSSRSWRLVAKMRHVLSPIRRLRARLRR